MTAVPLVEAGGQVYLLAQNDDCNCFKQAARMIFLLNMLTMMNLFKTGVQEAGTVGQD